MKRIVRLTTLVVTMILMSTLAFATNREIDVQIKNAPVDFTKTHNGTSVGKPYIANNRTHLPLRVISEDLGYDVEWNGDTRTAVIKEKDTTVEITIGQAQALVNGEKTYIDVSESGTVSHDTKAVIKNNRTYVPVRFVAEAMGERVEYRDPNTSSVKNPTVYINSINLPEEKKEETTVVKPDKDALVPNFDIVGHKQAGAMDYKIFVKNFKEYEGTGAKFSPVLVSHPEYNQYKVKDPIVGDWNIQKDFSKRGANKTPVYYQSTFRLIMWKRDGRADGKLDINTGKPQMPPKIGEIMTWHITIDMDNKPSEVYEIEIPYKGFTESIVTSGKRIK